MTTTTCEQPTASDPYFCGAPAIGSVAIPASRVNGADSFPVCERHAARHTAMGHTVTRNHDE